MMSGTTIDNTVVGGPAYNSKQLGHGDVILEVDAREARNENIFELLIGNDIPGSAVHIKVAKGGPKVMLTCSYHDKLYPLMTLSPLLAGTGSRSEIEKDGHQ